MSNQIAKIDKMLPSNSTTTVIVHPKGNYFEHVDTVNFSGNIYNISTIVNGHTITSNIKPNNDFYNLFVLDGEDFSKCYFIINRANALKYLKKDIEYKFSKNNKESLDVCIYYPCLFVNKNKGGYKKAEDSQLSYFGYLTRIEEIDCGYKFFFSIVSSLPQNIFNDNASIFDIKNSRGENELDIIHWSIKHINLVDCIRSLGYNVAAY